MPLSDAPERLITGQVIGFNENIYLALLAEQAERYEDMVTHTKLVVMEGKGDLTKGA